MPWTHDLVGNKLVGLVGLGTHPSYEPPQGRVIHSPIIRVTNPNCNSGISYVNMHIIQSNVIPSGNPPQPGDVVDVKYEDDFLAVMGPVSGGGWTMVPKSIMKPHESWECPLFLIPAIGPSSQHYALYIVEISWTSDEPGRLPLIGFQRERIRIVGPGTKEYLYETESQMVHQVHYCPKFW